MKAVFAISLILCVAGPSGALAHEQTLYDVVPRDPLTAGGVWLEMYNVFDEWERVVLVFGFADPGDWEACESIRAVAAQQNPSREYRCNPVN